MGEAAGIRGRHLRSCLQSWAMLRAPGEQQGPVPALPEPLLPCHSPGKGARCSAVPGGLILHPPPSRGGSELQGAGGCRLAHGQPSKPMACFIRRMRKCRQKETNSCLLLPCIPGHHMPPASAPQTAARCSWSGMGTPGGTLQASPGPRGEAKARVALPGSGTPRQPVGSSGCHPLPHQPLCALPPPASPHGCRGAPHPQLPTRAPSSPRPHPHHPSPNPPRLTVPSSPPPSHPRGPAAPP